MPDPWAEFHLEDIETELCIRYRCERLCVNCCLLWFLMFSNAPKVPKQLYLIARDQ